jgi:HNH endonuclease
VAEWRDVAGYDGEYQVDENGNVRRCTLRPQNGYSAVVRHKTIGAGYRAVWLGGRDGQNHYVHRLVAFAFLGPPPSDRHQVAHWDGDKTHNSVANLRWATASENRLDMRRQNANPKLTAANVAEIRAQQGPHLTMTLARRFGVGRTHIRRIQRGEMWN